MTAPVRARARVLLGCLLLLVHPSCRSTTERSTPAAQAGPDRVKLVLNWVAEPEFGGFYAARDQGHFARAGLDVDILGGGAGVPVLQMVAAGQAQFGVAGADEVLLARARGVDLVAWFAVYQTSPRGIMAHAERAKTLADVFGGAGTVALETGAPYTLFLKRKFGFAKATIVPYDGGVARFLIEPQHAQQCFVTSEPLAVRQKGGAPAVFLVADAGYNPYMTVIVTRRPTSEQERERAARFVRAARAGWQAYLQDPAPANRVMAKLNTTLDEATFAAIAAMQKPLIETAETRTRGLGTMTRTRWATLANQLRELGLIDKTPDIDAILMEMR